MSDIRALSNGHTHTSLCDGADSPAEMAAAAYRLGFKSLGFSGHSYCEADGYGMAEAALAAYCEAVLALREEYAGRMAVYLGLELDSLSAVPGALFGHKFDYLIGSVHNLADGTGRVWPVDESAELAAAGIAAFGGAEAYARAYFRAVAEMLDKLDQWPVDICGHFDLICKFNGDGCLWDEEAAWYRELAAATLRQCCRKNRQTVFEINTGAMFKGYLPRPYPDYWLWEVLRDEGAWVMVNSDAHSAAGLAYGLAELRQRALKFGLKVVDIDEIIE